MSVYKIVVQIDKSIEKRWIEWFYDKYLADISDRAKHVTSYSVLKRNDSNDIVLYEVSYICGSSAEVSFWPQFKKLQTKIMISCVYWGSKVTEITLSRWEHVTEIIVERDFNRVGRH